MTDEPPRRRPPTECACGQSKWRGAKQCIRCYRSIRRAWKLPLAYLTPEEQRYRRMKHRANYAKRRPSPLWQAAVRAEKALARGFLRRMEVAELYHRWQEWKTAERLLWLAHTAEEGA